MKRCPACGRRIRVSDPAERLSCPACGWGTGRPAAVPKRVRTRRRRVRATNLTNVVLLWFAAVGIVALAAWIVFGLVGISATYEHVLIFAGCVVGYAVFGHFIQPAADAEGTDWLFGDCSGGRNQTEEEGLGGVALSIALFPGRVIGLAFVHTVCLLRQREKRQPGPPLSGRFE